MKKMMQKPEPPESDECCGEGCCPCIWDVYYHALERWQEQHENAEQDVDDSGDSIS